MFGLRCTLIRAIDRVLSFKYISITVLRDSQFLAELGKSTAGWSSASGPR